MKRTAMLLLVAVLAAVLSYRDVTTNSRRSATLVLINGTIHTSAVAARCCKKHLLDASLLAAIQLIHPSIVERGDRIGLFAP